MVELREKIAELEHKQWVEWSKEVCKKEDIGELTQSRWSYFWKSYKKLTEEEKELDRKWADKVIRLLINIILEHKSCREYHIINGKKATCLDVILKMLGYTTKKK